MPKQPALPSLSDAWKKEQTRREAFLAEMDVVMPWTQLEAFIESRYPKKGKKGSRPIMPLSTMPVHFHD